MRKAAGYWLIVAIAVVLALTLPAGAQTQGSTQTQTQSTSQTPVVDQRQKNQKTRIKRGVKSGELTGKETVGLAKDQKEIHEAEKEAKADGVVTSEERKELRQEQNEASREIFKEKHDAQQQPTGPLGTKTPGVNYRQERQSERIQQGVKSGELTAKERAGLAQDQKEIREDKREAKSDGTVTKEERKELHQEQNQASKNIYKQKHDAQKRPKAKKN